MKRCATYAESDCRERAMRSRSWSSEAKRRNCSSLVKRSSQMRAPSSARSSERSVDARSSRATGSARRAEGLRIAPEHTQRPPALHGVASDPDQAVDDARGGGRGGDGGRDAHRGSHPERRVDLEGAEHAALERGEDAELLE